MAGLKIVVLNQLAGNFGDEAAGAALIDLVAECVPDASFRVFYAGGVGSCCEWGLGPSVEHLFLPSIWGWGSLPRWKIGARVAGRALSALVLGRYSEDLDMLVRSSHDADLVLVSPAGANLGIYRDWRYLLVLLLVVACGVTPRFSQNTIGPSGSWLFDRISLWVLRRCRVFVREEVSWRWLSKKRIHSDLGVDVAVLHAGSGESCYKPEYSGSSDVVGGDCAAEDDGYVAVVPTRLGDWHSEHKGFQDRKFVQEVLARELGQACRARGIRVIVLTHLFGCQDDSDVIDWCVAGLEAEGCVTSTVVPVSYREYMDVLGGAVIAVSMRYHGLLLAGSSGVPCVGIAYENKMREAADYLGMSELCVDLKSVDGEVLRKMLNGAFVGRDQFAEELRHRLPILRRIAAGPVLEALATAIRR